MEKTKNVSFKSNSHNRDISQNRLKAPLLFPITDRIKYRLFVRHTFSDGGVRISEDQVSADLGFTSLCEVIDHIYDLFSFLDGAYTRGLRVALSRYYFKRYSYSRPWVVDYLSKLTYLDSRYHLDDGDHVVAFAACVGTFSRIDLILRVCK